MIELQVKGPRKKQIMNSLRQKSRYEKDQLQMLRLKYASLKQYETDKFLQIGLPKILREKRKNQIPKLVSHSLLNKIQQNSSLTEAEAKHLLNLSTQSKSKILIKTKPKQSFFQLDSLHHSQHLIKLPQRLQNHKQADRFEQKQIKLLGLDKQRNFSFSKNKPIEDLKERSKSVTVNIFEMESQKLATNTLTENYKLQFRKINNPLSLNVNMSIKKIENFAQKKLNPSICVIHKLKTQQNDNRKTNLLRKIRNRQDAKLQSKKRLQTISYQRPCDFQNIEQADPYVNIDMSQFHKSFGPWRNTGLTFNK